MNDRILILGNGGHSLTVQEALVRSDEDVPYLGIVDKEDHASPSPFQIPIIGNDKDLPSLFAQGWHQAVVAIGSLANTVLRRQLTEKLKKIGFILPYVIDSSAIVSQYSVISQGAFAAKRVTVQPKASIAEMTILNTGCIIEHGCHVGAFSHISSGAVLLGDVIVGDDTLIGGGSVVRQGVRIGSRCIVGAGSVVAKDIPDGSIAFGNPCTVRRII